LSYLLRLAHVACRSIGRNVSLRGFFVKKSCTEPDPGYDATTGDMLVRAATAIFVCWASILYATLPCPPAPNLRALIEFSKKRSE
jgi:hypothetical protein